MQAYCPRCKIDVEAETKVSHTPKNPNKEYLMCPKNHFIKFTGKVVEAQQVSNQNEVWTKKDQMGARQTATNCSFGLIGSMVEAGNKMTLDEATNEGLRIAGRLYDFVYDGKIQELSDAEAEQITKDCPF